MKAFFFLAALAIVGLVVTGAISLRRSGNSITIEIDKQRVANDAKAVVDEGKQVLRQAEASLDAESTRK